MPPRSANPLGFRVVPGKGAFDITATAVAAAAMDRRTLTNGAQGIRRNGGVAVWYALCDAFSAAGRLAGGPCAKGEGVFVRGRNRRHGLRLVVGSYERGRAALWQHG